jgi:DNA primase
MSIQDLDSVKHRILSRLSLADLVGSTVKLTKRSGRFVGLCPFHNEKGPSFTLYDDHYYCFGCHASGDAIDFVRKTQGIGFMDALRHLAERAGVEMPELERKRGDDAALKERAALYSVMQQAQNFFVGELQREAGSHAHEYLLQRGFSKESIQQFGFGYALDDFEVLTRYLKQMGFTESQLIDTSLASISAKTNRPYDFFRNRLMIPIRDVAGRVIAFGGRTLGNDPAKYVNSRESKLYDKSTVLFGLDRAKDAIRKAGRALVTEGYMDTLQLWQKEIHETVACLGTALTVQQLKLLAPHCKKVFLFFDGDAAGQSASLRSVSVALEVPDIDVRVAIVPAGHDPDSFARERGAEGIRALVANAEPLLDFAIRTRLKTAHGLAIPELVNSEFIPWLARTPDSITRSYLTQRLAEKTGISVQQLNAEIRKLLGGELTRTNRGLSDSNPSSIDSGPRYHLDPFDVDLLGHLFFAEPDEAVIRSSTELVGRKNWPESLNIFASEMLDCLRTKASPHTSNYRIWTSYQIEAITHLIDGLIKRENAFKPVNTLKAMEQISRRLDIKDKKEVRARLKEQLVRCDPDEQREILGAIKKLNAEIAAFEGAAAPK